MHAVDRVRVISSAQSKIARWAAGRGCSVVRRGNTEHSLAEAVSAMGVSADLVVLDGHGSASFPRYCSSSDPDTASWIEFEPARIGAPRVIMCICHGLADHYMDRLTACNPQIEVVGVDGTISSSHYFPVVRHLIERFLEGADLAAALNEARSDGLRQIDRWDRVVGRRHTGRGAMQR